LIDRYAKKAAKKVQGNRQEGPSSCLKLMTGRGTFASWQNVIERAVVLCDGDTFSIDERAETDIASGART